MATIGVSYPRPNFKTTGIANNMNCHNVFILHYFKVNKSLQMKQVLYINGSTSPNLAFPNKAYHSRQQLSPKSRSTCRSGILLQDNQNFGANMALPCSCKCCCNCIDLFQVIESFIQLKASFTNRTCATSHFDTTKR